MDEKVKEQILAIRDSGLTNMFDLMRQGSREALLVVVMYTIPAAHICR